MKKRVYGKIREFRNSEIRNLKAQKKKNLKSFENLKIP